MSHRTPLHTRLLAAVLCGATAFVSSAEVNARESASYWQPAWVSPVQPTWDPGFVLPLGMPTHLRDATLRQTLRTSLGGERMRLVISNEYSPQPLHIARVAVGLEARAEASLVRFHGQSGGTLPPGSRWISDPVHLPLQPGARLRVDVHLREARLAGFHWDARDSAWLLPGPAAGNFSVGSREVLTTRAFVTELLVEARRPPAAVVALGDSITDGNGSTPGRDQRWPDHLSRRLAPHGIAVLNAGISGNRLLRDGMGESGLSRLHRDVFRHQGVHALIVLLGTNDIGWPGGAFAPAEPAMTVDQLSAGFRQLVEQARSRGIRVVGATLPPFEGALAGTPLEGHYSPEKEVVRQAINAWIRGSGAFDAVADFDAVLRDPARPTRLRPEFDSGDHLHPGDAGYKAMADAIDIALLTRQRPAGARR
jgi:lysophospholipase L1-like esterase